MDVLFSSIIVSSVDFPFSFLRSRLFVQVQNLTNDTLLIPQGLMLGEIICLEIKNVLPWNMAVS
jgi:hypothetical protein